MAVIVLSLAKIGSSVSFEFDDIVRGKRRAESDDDVEFDEVLLDRGKRVVCSVSRKK